MLVSRRRPQATDHTLSRVLSQRMPVCLLVVVNVEADADTQKVVDAWSARHPEVEYLPIADNVGPAGAVRIGVEMLLRRRPDAEFIALFEDDDPPPDDEALARLVAHLEQFSPAERVGGVGLHGACFSWPLAVLRRPALSKDGYAEVDYLAGGAVPPVQRRRHSGRSDREVGADSTAERALGSLPAPAPPLHLPPFPAEAADPPMDRTTSRRVHHLVQRPPPLQPEQLPVLPPVGVSDSERRQLTLIPVEAAALRFLLLSSQTVRRWRPTRHVGGPDERRLHFLPCRQRPPPIGVEPSRTASCVGQVGVQHSATAGGGRQRRLGGQDVIGMAPDPGRHPHLLGVLR